MPFFRVVITLRVMPTRSGREKHTSRGAAGFLFALRWLALATSRGA
ncbi:MAG: hypothetical protein L0241_07285 [Planctomycetia bacterium]|nr:hypothetical protein [Planctomycetia bacterium]